VPTRIRGKSKTTKLNISLKSRNAQLTFAEKFKVECIEGSGISESVFDAAIDFIEDTGRWECHEALNLEVKREWKTRKPHNFDTLAVFRNEDGTVWHSKAKNPLVDFDGRERRYQAPAGNGSQLFMPTVTVGVWVSVAERNGLEESLPEWVRRAHENGHDKLKSGTRESEIFATTLKTERTITSSKASLSSAEDGLILDSCLIQDLGKESLSQSYLKPSDFFERGTPETKSFSASGMDWDTESKSVLMRTTSNPSEMLSTLECISFWDWVLQTSCPLILTEGGKKSMSLLSIGYAAVAVYGINAGYGVRVDGIECPPFLIPDLQSFTATPRKFIIAFDQDESAKTRRKVSRATIKMGLLLETAGSKVQIAEWDSALGKGVDDVVVSSGAAMIDRIFNDTSVIKDAEKAERLERAKAALSCTRTPDLIVNSQYIDFAALPELKPGQLVAVSSSLGTGKTEIAINLKRASRQKNPDAPVILLGHRNSLLLQSCQRLGIDHIWKMRRDYPGRLNYGLGVEKGIGMCPDSMPDADWDKLPADPFFLLDESESIMGHVTKGDTLGERHNEVLNLFQSSLTRALATGGIVVTMEASLTDLSLDFYEELTGVRPFYIRNDWVPQKEAEFQTDGETGFIESIIRELEAGLDVFFVSDSQKICEKLELLASARTLGIPMIRCDVKTSEFPEVKRLLADPNGEIERNRPRLINCSPSVESGLNITAPGYHVRAYFNNGETRSQYQQLGRVRNPESIKIYCAPRGLRSGPTYPSQILKDSRILKKHTAILTELRAELEGDEAAIAKLNETLSDSDKKELFWAKHAANLEARANLLSRDMADNLRNYLRDQGWTITEVEGFKDDGIKKALEAAKEVIEGGEAALKFRLPGGQNAETAKRILSSGSAKYEERVNAQKSMLMLALPGAPLSEEFLLDMVVKDRGRGVKRKTWAWMSQHPEIAKKIDQASFRSQLSKPFILSRRLTHLSQKVDLFHQSGLEAIKATKRLHEQHPLIVAFRGSMLDNAAGIRRVFGLNMNEGQTGMQMLSKLLSQFGDKLECTGRPGKRGDRVRIYEVVSAYPESHQKEVFDALDRKWRADLESVSTVSSNTNTYIKMVDTEPEPPPLEESPPPLMLGDVVIFGKDRSTCRVHSIQNGQIFLKRIDSSYQTQIFSAKEHEFKLAS
jgi:hypothetical protein